MYIVFSLRSKMTDHLLCTIHTNLLVTLSNEIKELTEIVTKLRIEVENLKTETIIEKLPIIKEDYVRDSLEHHIQYRCNLPMNDFKKVMQIHE